MYIDDYFAQREDCNVIDDKNLYDLLFYDVRQPRTIARVADGVFLSSDYRPISEADFLSLCKSEKGLIIKQRVDSEGGKGVIFFDVEKDDISKMRACLKKKNVVVQQIVEQHPELKKLHPESLNTIRILTLYFEGEVHVVSTVVRMGVGSSRVDNASSGGIVCGVNSDGSLKDRAFDTKANRYDEHPSGVRFKSITVPGVDECRSLCVMLALRLVRFTRLVSWDFAIDQNGHPILIEANLSYGQIDFHQMCNGLVFGDMTERLVNYVYENNPYLNKKI